MLYHKRPELTRMSMWHMAKVIKMFNDAGHKAHGIVVGCRQNDLDSTVYAESLGLRHFQKENSPLYKKFGFAFSQALLMEDDYICKMDSNNFNSKEYWDKCINKISNKKVVSFGTNKFTVLASDPSLQKTCVFTTRKKIHLCNSGQFYLNYSLSQAVNFRSIYDENQRNNFDGKINKAFSEKWGPGVIEIISSDPEDCFDVKSSTDIHSYDSYICRSPKIYPEYKTRKELLEEFEELKLLDLGYFTPDCDRIVEPGADLSELERI